MILKQTCSQVFATSAVCVQRFDDSLGPAIHITYRSSLRSSSMHEPRDPPLEVVIVFLVLFFCHLLFNCDAEKANEVILGWVNGCQNPVCGLCISRFGNTQAHTSDKG